MTKNKEQAQEQANVLELPYSDRQLIVVTEDEVARVTRKSGWQSRQEKNGIDWARIGEIAFRDMFPFGNILAEITKETIRAWGRAKENGVSILPVGKSEALDLGFPPGHPREGLLYIGHPAIPSVYYTTAEFHRVTFEHKFSEAVKLLMYLGAIKVRVEHISGWDKDFSAKLSVPLGNTSSNVQAEVGSTASSGSKLLYEATFAGSSEPKIPEGLVWFPYEPTWQSIAEGRSKFGLQNFSLSVCYEDDFGVNAGLKATIIKSGLELGGKFEDHQSTVWKIEGEFKPVEG